MQPWRVISELLGVAHCVARNKTVLTPRHVSVLEMLRRLLGWLTGQDSVTAVHCLSQHHLRPSPLVQSVLPLSSKRPIPRTFPQLPSSDFRAPNQVVMAPCSHLQCNLHFTPWYCTDSCTWHCPLPYFKSPRKFLFYVHLLSSQNCLGHNRPSINVLKEH